MDIAVVACESEATMEACLTSCQEALRQQPTPGGELIVLDDASLDGTAALTGDLAPEARLIRAASRQGFPASANQAMMACPSEFVLLLNADVIIEPDCLSALASALEDPSVFAAAPLAFLMQPGRIDMARSVARMERGWMRWRSDLDPDLPGDTFYASGGYAAIRKEAFIAIQGFRQLFAPGYWEDVDLCYRAWKRGWTVRFEPRARVRHLKGHTFSKMYDAGRLNVLKSRNRFLFMWMNLDARTLVSHWMWLPLKLSRAVCQGRWGFLLALSQALARWPQARILRRKERPFWKRPDGAILRHVARSGRDEGLEGV